MDSAVVHEVDLHHVMSTYFEKFSHRPTEKIVADMTKMKRFICIW